MDERHFHIAARRRRRKLIVLLGTLCVVVLLGVRHATMLTTSSESLLQVYAPNEVAAAAPPAVANSHPSPFLHHLDGFFSTDPCFDWDPFGDPADDPKDCFRARQFRQIQKVKAIVGIDKIYDEDLAVMLAVDHAEKCALGLEKCPARPLIVTDWVYIRQMDGWPPNGESVWTRPILEAARAAGYTVARFDGNKELHHLWRFLTLMHVYWAGEQHSTACLHHPRCVRPEDYTPHPNPKFRYDVESIPTSELGTTPAWRVMTITFWGSRPDPYGNNHMNAKHDYGIEDGHDWSWHNLGPKFQLTPYPYPNHTHIPITIERTCLASPRIPYAQRDDAVAILAKRTPYFQVFDGLWDRITWTMKHTLGAALWSFAAVDHDVPVPNGLVDIGRLPHAAYGAKLSRAKALLGLGDPPISPTPYAALCRGVPAVLPYRGDTPTPAGWALYDMAYTQHGPANTIGEPYVYTYKIDDVENMLAKLQKAYSTPIAPYIPPEMRLKEVYRRTLAVLEHDWEGEYKTILAQNGGRIPQFPPQMIETCVLRKNCKPFSNEMSERFYFEHERKEREDQKKKETKEEEKKDDEQKKDEENQKDEEQKKKEEENKNEEKQKKDHKKDHKKDK